MPTKTTTISGPKWPWKKIKRMKMANIKSFWKNLLKSH